MIFLLFKFGVRKEITIVVVTGILTRNKFVEERNRALGILQPAVCTPDTLPAAASTEC